MSTRVGHSVAVAVSIVLALSGCFPVFVPSLGDLEGSYVAESSDGQTAHLLLDSNGTFSSENFPVAAIGSVPRSLDWEQVADLSGEWADDGRGTVTFDFSATESTSAYHVSALASTERDGVRLRFPVSSDEGIYLVFTESE